MKKNVFYIIILFACIFDSCNSGSKKSELNLYADENTRIIHIDLDNKVDKVKDIFEFSHFISLETAKHALISQVSKIEFDNDYIYILDSKQRALFIFNLDGSYSHKIYKLGQSSEEYISAEDFYLDKIDKKIYILDGLQGRILMYDTKGEFIEKHDVKKSYAISRLNDSWLLYLGNGAADFSSDKTYNNLIIYDENFQIKKEGLAFNPELIGRRFTYNTAKSIFTKGKNIDYILPLNDYNIYKYNNDSSSLSIAYSIDFKGLGNLNLSIDASSSEVENYLSNTLNSDDIPSKLHSFYKLKNNIFFGFLYKSSPYYCLFNEKNESVNLTQMDFDENGIMFVPVSYVSKDETDLILSCLDGELI